jgi:hypothetical protein
MKTYDWGIKEGREFGEAVASIDFEYPMITFHLNSIVTSNNPLKYSMLKCLGASPVKEDIHKYPTNLKSFINTIDDEVLITIIDYMDFDVRMKFEHIIKELI